MTQCAVLARPRYPPNEEPLAEWAAVNRQRDARVRAAFRAGITKRRIHQITGISRTTIDAILTEDR